MNRILSVRSISLFSIAILGCLRAVDVSPRLSDSPEAQRTRDLTLVGRSAERGSAEVSAAKVRVLVELAKTLQTKLAAIEARLRAGGSDQLVSDLRNEREALLKRETEVGQMLKKAMLMQAIDAAR